MNENCPCEAVEALIKRIDNCESRLHRGDVSFAVINTKLTAIIWLLCVTGTSLIGLLVKLMFGKTI